MFYESKHPLNADYFKCETGVDFSFPSHLHHCFEFLYIINGQMNVQIDDLSYTLAEGSGLLIFPNQIHSLNCTNHSEHILCLFSPKLVSAFTEKNTSKVPTDNLFFPDSFYITQLKYLSGTNINENKILLKGLLYSLCGEFNKTASYHEASVGSNILLHNIFNFIETNYNKNCLLEDLSKHTGYNYAYLSKYFKKCVGISFNDYVCQYRISQACYLLQNSEMTILEISDECGFNSLRSLNRNFKEQLGIPPAEYRRELKAQNRKEITDHEHII